jgi:DNA-binding NtrC family response regulator
MSVSQKVILASRDAEFLRTGSLIFKYAGYRTACANSLSQARSLSDDLDPNLIILAASFSDLEQQIFVEELNETQPGLAVICLKFGVVDATMLLSECRSILSSQSTCTRVRSLRVN